MTSPKVKLSTDSLQYLALFENVARARPIDIVEFMDSELIFFVKKEEMFMIDLNPSKPLNRLSRMLNKRVKIFAYSESPEEFISCLFRQVKVELVDVSSVKDGRKIAYVKVSEKDKGKAIGMGGANAKRASFLAKRYFDIDLVKIM